MLTDVVMFTDGAAGKNPGTGGYGVVILRGKRATTYAGGYALTTSCRMELWAAVHGLRALEESSKVTVFSDSRYLVDAITKGWLKYWATNGWRRKDGGRAKNVDLWQQLSTEMAKHTCRFEWVRGHNGNPENERADVLAATASKKSGWPPDPGYERGKI